MSQTYVVPTDWKSEKWWRNRSVDERMFHSRVPNRWRSIGLDDLTISDKAMKAINHWVYNYQFGDSLILTGVNGSGKSVTSQAILQYLIREKGVSGRFISADRYIDMLKDSFEGDNGLLPDMYSMPYLLKYIQGVFDVVVLDGVGQERQTDYSVHEVGSLIRRRYEDSRTTIITTTLSQIDFTRRYGDRIAVAVSDMTGIRIA